LKQYPKAKLWIEEDWFYTLDWKEVVHSSKGDLQEIYDWIKKGKEDELIRQWLSI